ncbi:MAG: hypothetical protein WBC33_07015, partial [Conexibacter sp.]
MQLAPTAPNVDVRSDEERGRIVVLAFPYDPHIVEVVRGIPHRRFDWDAREWWAPVDDWVALHVVDVLRRFPELTASERAAAWLQEIEQRWIGHVRTARYDGRGWWVLQTLAGEVPAPLREEAVVREDGTLLVPLTEGNAHILREQQSARLDAAAERCVAALELG